MLLKAMRPDNPGNVCAERFLLDERDDPLNSKQSADSKRHLRDLNLPYQWASCHFPCSQCSTFSRPRLLPQTRVKSLSAAQFVLKFKLFPLNAESLFHLLASAHPAFSPPHPHSSVPASPLSHNLPWPPQTPEQVQFESFSTHMTEGSGQFCSITPHWLHIFGSRGINCDIFLLFTIIHKPGQLCD